VKRLAILLAVLALGMAVPTLATAQFSPTNIPAPLTQTNPDDNVIKPADEDDGLSGWQYLLMFGGSIAVLGTIAWYILRDAHRAAPVVERGQTSTSAPGAKKSARERERERARKRNKAKAVKNQRKRNRPH
jgi:hypothetical protein